MTNYTFIDNPLKILYSCRLRLTDEQRQTLKDAHNKVRSASTPAVAKPVMAGSSISVADYTQPQIDVYKASGMSGVVINDILTSRESISLPVIIKVQRALGVEVITKKALEAQFQHYLTYVLEVMD